MGKSRKWYFGDIAWKCTIVKYSSRSYVGSQSPNQSQIGIFSQVCEECAYIYQDKTLNKVPLPDLTEDEGKKAAEN